jgi:hypothetical protein
LADSSSQAEGIPTLKLRLKLDGKWRQIVSAVLARLATEAEFGDDDEKNLTPREITDGGIRQMLGIVEYDRAYWDRTGIFILETALLVK